jgi:hypothetical protein
VRQVMPHRNNIVADHRRCKTFLRPMGGGPLNSGDCGISVRTLSDRRKAELLRYNRDLERYSYHQSTDSYQKQG